MAERMTDWTPGEPLLEELLDCLLAHAELLQRTRDSMSMSDPERAEVEVTLRDVTRDCATLVGMGPGRWVLPPLQRRGDR